MIEACKAESRTPSNVQEKKQSKGGVNMLGLEFLKTNLLPNVWIFFCCEFKKKKIKENICQIIAIYFTVLMMRSAAIVHFR